LFYQREQEAACSYGTGDEAYNFVMMTLTDAGDPGMVSLPAHRLVRLTKPEKTLELRERLSVLFDLEYLDPAGATRSDTLEVWLGILGERGKKGIAIGVYGIDEGRFCLLTPKKRTKLDAMLPPECSQDLKNLDVASLHWIILRQLIGVDTPEKEEDYLRYTQDEQEAIGRVDSGEYQLAFLMNAIPISSILAVADAGDRMPPKSTYFYPKLPTGLVMYPLWDDEP